MPRIKEVLKLLRRFSAQAKGIVTLQVERGLVAIGLKNAQKTAGTHRTEVTQAAFPEKISEVRRSMPGA